MDPALTLIALCSRNANKSQGGMNLPEIKDELKSRGLSTAGTRAELRTRLCAALAAKQTPESKQKQKQESKQKHKQTDEENKKIVYAFSALCGDRNHCYNGEINRVMESGNITVGGKSVTLPDINPFKYLNLQQIKQKIAKLPEKVQLEISWRHVTGDRIDKLIKIADMLDNTTDGFLRAIEMCLAYYISDTEIAFLLYATGLLGMCLWDEFFDFPLVVTWANDNNDGVLDEKINMVVPMPYYKWSLFNMFIKILNANIDQQQQQQQQQSQQTEEPTTWLWSVVNYFGKTDTKTPRSYTSINSNYLYTASAYDSYTMSYYDHDNLTANCVLSTLLEATYLQDHMNVVPSKIFLRMQHPPSHKKVQWRSLLSLKDIGSMATHFATTYQASDKKIHDLRLISDLTCTREKLPYKGNELYIAMTVMYLIIGSFKVLLRNNTKTLKLKNRRDFASRKIRTAYIFYNLRVLLEHKLASAPITVDEIYENYIEDINREFSVSGLVKYDDLLTKWSPNTQSKQN
jgi:hypothetical protein